MRIKGFCIRAALTAILAALFTPGGPALGQTAAYLNHDQLTRELRSLTGGSDLARMESLGKTVEGRDIWLVTVGDPEGPPLEERPAVLVVANLEGDHLAGSQLALESLRYLLRNAGDDAVRSALQEHAFYFFPRLNPDGAEGMFAPVKWNRKRNARPFDDDNDGRTDEDGPEDLNGDGVITVMRVEEPGGPYTEDPADPRLLKRADPSQGESGRFQLYLEGTDNDGDGFINEDGPGGVDLNRNFQHEYPYWQRDAGPYMVSEVESRALMDFVIAHRNIAAILTFGESDNLVTPPDSRGSLAAAKGLDLPAFAAASNDGVFDVGVFGRGGGGGFGRGFGGRRGGGGGYLRGAQPGADNDPSSGQRPVTTVAQEDLPYFRAVSDAYRRITGIQRVPIHRRPEGAFFQYGYFQFGVPSFSTPGWALPGEASEGGGRAQEAARATATGGAPAQASRATAGSGGGRMGRGGAGGQAAAAGRAESARGGAPQASRGAAGTDATVLAALEAAGIEAFADWTPFEHPTLGRVEIGGFLPYVTHNPPAEQLPELGEKHGQFLVELAGMLPRARIAEAKVTAHGGNLFTVTVAVENRGFFPTSLQHGTRSRSVGPTLVQIQVDNEDILSGADKTVSVGTLDGAGGREEVTWLIRGRRGAEVEIRLISQKAGRDTATVTLR